MHVAREMQRNGFELPLLIGGATTSSKHTAVKIAPQYHGTVIHVKDASKSVGVVDRLGRSDARAELDRQNRVQQEQERAAFGQRAQRKLVPYAEALRRRLALDWSGPPPAVPLFVGTRTLLDIPLEQIVPFIDWSPFFLAWELKGKYPRIFNDPELGPRRKELFDDARELLGRIVAGKRLTANAVYGFYPANSDGDDIVLYEDESRQAERMRLPTLRQQWERDGQTSFRSLADYIAPRDSGIPDYLGAFAVTTGIGIESLVEQFEREHDDYNAIMAKALADRLAEALGRDAPQAGPRRMGLRPRRGPQLRRSDRGEVPGDPARIRLSEFARPHREARLVAAHGRRGGREDRAHGVVRHVPGRLGQRALFRPSPGPLLRGRLHHPGPGRSLRGPQGHAHRRGRALAGAEPGL